MFVVLIPSISGYPIVLTLWILIMSMILTLEQTRLSLASLTLPTTTNTCLPLCFEQRHAPQTKMLLAISNHSIYTRYTADRSFIHMNWLLIVFGATRFKRVTGFKKYLTVDYPDWNPGPRGAEATRATTPAYIQLPQMC